MAVSLHPVIPQLGQLCDICKETGGSDWFVHGNCNPFHKHCLRDWCLIKEGPPECPNPYCKTLLKKEELYGIWDEAIGHLKRSASLLPHFTWGVAAGAPMILTNAIAMPLYRQAIIHQYVWLGAMLAAVFASVYAHSVYIPNNPRLLHGMDWKQAYALQAGFYISVLGMFYITSHYR